MSEKTHKYVVKVSYYPDSRNDLGDSKKYYANTLTEVIDLVESDPDSYGPGLSDSFCYRYSRVSCIIVEDSKTNAFVTRYGQDRTWYRTDHR